MDYIAHIIVLVLLFAILGVSLNLLLGYTGLLSMGHAAFFGVAAYTSALVVEHLSANFLIGTMAGIAVTVILGAIIAIPALRVKDEYLVLLTLGFQMVVWGLMITNITLTGGTWGLKDIPRPDLFGFHFTGPPSYLPLILVFLALAFVVSWRVTHSPFGRVLKAMRDDDILTKSLGKNILAFKVLVFVIAGGIAAMAGSFFAHYMTTISPSSFSIYESVFIITIVLIGGRANIWGSVAGAFLLVVLPEALNYLPGTAELIGNIRMAIYGFLLILFAGWRPQGLIPEHAKFRKKRQVAQLLKEDKGVAQSGIASLHLKKVSDNPGSSLKIEGLIKNFGGMRAVDNSSFSLPEGKITALIGPNGAGKTTIFNLVTRFMKADSGRVFFRGQDISNQSADQVARLGIVRSFQEARIFDNMSVLDNVLVSCARQCGENLAFLFLRPGKVAREDMKNYQRAMTYLKFVGLAERAQDLGKDLSYAERKLLIIANMLATEADVLLLDEPISGVDPVAIDRVLDVIRQLADLGKTICIIEHNLDVVKRIAEFAYFLADGRVVTTGTPAELTANPKLAEIYFGA